MTLPRCADEGGARWTFDQVLAAAREDVPWAYTSLFRALARPVAGYLRAQGAREPDDLTNEVFLRAFRSLATFTGGEGDFRAWLFTIARNCLRNDWRRESRRPTLVLAAPGDGPGGDTEEDALLALGTDRVHAVLATLAPDQREVLLLRVLADMTVEQVAAAVGKSGPAVKALQRRGLAAIRRKLGTAVPL